MDVGISERLSDQWALVAGGLSGGLAGAMAAALAGFPVAIPVAVGVAGVVWGVKVGLDALADRGTRPALPRAPDLPPPPKGSPADIWLRRAEQAVRTLHDQTESPPDQVTRQQIGDVDDRAAETLADMRRLAAQVTAVENAARRIDVNRLRSETEQLRFAAEQESDPDIRADRKRTADAVAEQLAVAERLLVARDKLLARMQSTAIGLEGLIARLAEVLALAATTGGIDTTEQRITELSDELDGMQDGLRETEALSRQVLTGRAPAGR